MERQTVSSHDRIILRKLAKKQAVHAGSPAVQGNVNSQSKFHSRQGIEITLRKQENLE